MYHEVEPRVAALRVGILALFLLLVVHRLIQSLLLLLRHLSGARGACKVPPVWGVVRQQLLHHFQAAGGDLPFLEAVLVGAGLEVVFAFLAVDLRCALSSDSII